MSMRRRKRRPEVNLEERQAMRAARKAEGPTGPPLVDKVALDRAVARLPEGYRAVFGLYDVEGVRPRGGLGAARRHQRRLEVATAQGPAQAAEVTTSAGDAELMMGLCCENDLRRARA